MFIGPDCNAAAFEKNLFAICEQHGKKALMPYAYSEDPDKRDYLCSLIWTFSVRRHVLQYPLIL